MVAEVGALGRHLALVGFMGAGKTTIGREVARLAERPFVDTDAEIEKRFGPIPTMFEERGEAEFRRLEEEIVAEALARDEPAVVALGGGAVTLAKTCERLSRRAFTVWLDVDVGDAWERVRGTGRPLARDERRFRTLFAERRAIYEAVADGRAGDVDGVLLAALAIAVRPGSLAELAQHLPQEGRVALVADETVLSLHPPRWDAGSPALATTHALPAGKAAKTLAVAERLWRELTLDRRGTIVGFGGGSTTDVTGFVAATYLRGVRWIAVPTTLVGQVDAAIGGKTGVDLAEGKNVVGAFHMPERVAIDPDLLGTLPDRERRQGLAEVVKTGLLAGKPVWELPDEEMVRACAAFKAAVVLSDPCERGRRAILNLGHTFAHALETASRYAVTHGDAVALGLLAALRLSGQPTDVVETALRPRPVAVDRDAAWAALQRDKKAAGGRIRLVLLRAPGEPEHGVELPDEDVRAALNDLIAR